MCTNPFNMLRWTDRSTNDEDGAGYKREEPGILVGKKGNAASPLLLPIFSFFLSESLCVNTFYLSHRRAL